MIKSIHRAESIMMFSDLLIYQHAWATVLPRWNYMIFVSLLVMRCAATVTQQPCYNTADFSHMTTTDILSMDFIPLRPRRDRRHFADAIFKCIFLNANEWISLKISLKFVPKVRINNIPSLVQIMAWRRPGDKPLSEPMVVSLPTHICVTRPQWVKR